jgi:hypothetical protein
MRNMYLRQERDMERLIHSGGGSELGPAKVLNEVARISMIMHLEMDKIVRRATWIAQEQKMLAGDPIATRAEINAACDEAVRWTHPLGGTLYLPAMFRGNEFQKAVTTFHNATNRNFNLLLKSNVDVAAGKIGYGAWVGNLIGIGVVPAVILAAISLKRAPTAREIALEYLNQTSGSEIYLGFITQALMSGREASVTSPFADFANSAVRMVEGKSAETTLTQGLSMVDDLAGTPLSNLFKELMMLSEIFNDEYHGEPHRGFLNSLDTDEGVATGVASTGDMA